MSMLTIKPTTTRSFYLRIHIVYFCASLLLSFFSVLSQYWPDNSGFVYKSHLLMKVGKTGKPPAHSQPSTCLWPLTIVNHFYMNHDAIGRFSFSALPPVTIY